MSSDAIAAFLDAMRAAGIVPAEPITDKLGSKRIYFRCNCDRKGRKTGWAKLYLDGPPAGSFGSYKLGIVKSWRFGNGRTLTRQECREITQQRRDAAARREAELQAQWMDAATLCRRDWERAGPADRAHPYLIAKGVSGEALRQLGKCLLVPMFDTDGTLSNLQRIGADGTKLYAKGARAKGMFMTIGSLGKRLVIAEGYGTGAVIRRATSLPIVVAFTWGNLMPVAILMRERFPNSDIVIAADDDAHLVNHPAIQRNIGLDAARAAAEAIGGRLAVPPRELR